MIIKQQSLCDKLHIFIFLLHCGAQGLSEQHEQIEYSQIISLTENSNK